MNKKAILKELIKDPQIKALYNEGFDRSIVNKLVIESLIEEEDEFKIPSSEDMEKMSMRDLRRLSSKLSNIQKNKEDPFYAASFSAKTKVDEIIKAKKQQATSPSEPQQQTGDSGESGEEGLAEFIQQWVEDKSATIEKKTGIDPAEQIEYLMIAGELLAWFVGASAVKNAFKVLTDLTFWGNVLILIKQGNYKDAAIKVGAELAAKTVKSVLPSETLAQKAAGKIATSELGKKVLSKVGTEGIEAAIEAATSGATKGLTKLAAQTFGTDADDIKGELVPMKLIRDVSLRIAKMGLEFRDKQKERIDFLVQHYGTEKAQEVKNELALTLKEAGVQEETAVAIVNNKQAVKDLGIALQNTDTQDKLGDLQKSLKSLYDAVIDNNDGAAKDTATQIYNMIKGVNGFDKIEQTAQQLEKQTLEDIKNSYIETYEEYKEDLKLLEQSKQLEFDEQDEETKKVFLFAIIVGLYNAYNREAPSDDAEEKLKDEKPPAPEYIARESFLENWGPVGIAFDNYEDRFDQTPFLDEQAQVLFALRDALKDFDSGLRKAAKPTGKREEAPEQVQEQAGEVIQVQPQEQKKIFKLHKELIRETNALVKIIKQLDDQNIYTIGGGKIQKQARLKAKELMNLMKLAFDELEAIKGEEKEKLTFKEQQEMDEETELLRKSHQQILSNMTKMDRIARARPREDEDARIESKYITPVVEKTIKIIEDIEHMFPVSSPFGKKGNLGEIKIQVKGISRDIIDIVAKLKDFATSSKTRSQNVDKLKEYILNAMATISNSFDIDIEDEELQSLLPKKARPNSPSYNKGAAELKEKLDDLMQKYGPKVKEVFEKAKDKEGALSKIIKFVEKATSKITKDKTVTPEIVKQTLKGVAEFDEEMLDKLQQGKDLAILPSIVKKLQKDENYEITTEEKQKLLKSFATHVSGQTSKRKVRKAIMNWFVGLEPDEMFSQVKRMFKLEEEQKASYKHVKEVISSHLVDVVKSYASNISYRGKLAAQGAATRNMMDIIEEPTVEEYLKSNYVNQDIYEAFGSFASDLRQGITDRYSSDDVKDKEQTPDAKDGGFEDDEAPTGLEKYYDVNNKEVSIERQKDILETFFQQMKGEYMTEVKVLFSKQLQQQGIDRNTAIKASNSYKEIKHEFLPSEQKWLKKTLIKMAKEDRDLFMKSAGRDRVNSPEPKQEQIERKLETIIEHYLNTGKL